MRVLVVSQYFWPEVFRVNEIVSELRARGHEVTVLTGRPNYPGGQVFEDYAADPAAFAGYHGADVVRLPLRPRGQGSVRLLLNYWSFVFWGCLLGPWKLRGRRFDAIFCFETSPITSALPAVLLRWIKGAPLLLWVLDLWPDTLAAVGMVRSKLGLNAVGALVRFIYKRCDLILAQSRSFFPAIERWSRAPAKTRYFPQWAEAIFDGDMSGVAVAPELAPHAEAFKVMFAGNIGDAQDFPALLAAAEATRARPDIHWLIVGDGRQAEWLRTEIQRRSLQTTVFMLGRHPIERMPEFFMGADALLVSLKAEPIFAMTIPGKVAAYLAASRPLLAMLDGEGAQVITEAGAGLVAPAGDGPRLAALAQRLLATAPQERAAMGQRAREYCRQHFDRVTLIDQLEEWLGTTRIN
ncbi:glycosyltransferase involved in cell wall biosynthesis [Pelomonas saccharophila]|uniref:Glycosyltransferase involved in cell wall biosynthesis n=1 Tax=Roseateles saccharophilus TaxID=304 RepID=A0ABU1YUJ3_ROSSA|nr:glycosyltransferase family 4 protein [Roseateles saccharophilus]MDR7271851.1 glycosyltransferase involved in cell wall biosynthesis [Roseateles saccharophilus]